MKKLSKILVLVLVLAMMFAMTSMFTASAANIPAGTVLYLVPSANWNQSNARFAAYFFGSGEAWVSMTKVAGESNLYQVTVPSGSWTNVIFCRMNPSNSANSWNTKWNQTADLTFNGTSNCFTVKEGTWDKGGGTWSTYGSSCTHANVGPAATCTTSQDCLDCGDPVVSALGHTYNSAHLCTRCNGQATFTVAGSGAHLGTEWDTGNVANDMTFADGTYTKVYTNVAAGSYLLKVVRDHDWGTAYPDADKAYTVATAGSTVTVTLKGTTVDIKVDAPHTHTWSDATCTEAQKCACGETQGEALGHTWVDATYSAPKTCSVCKAIEGEALEVKFPNANVVALENTGLTFALTFTIEDLEAILADEAYCQALLAKYSSWYVDYRLTISGLSGESVTFNANGEADGYLAGQYDADNENYNGEWTNVPDENLVIKNGESILVMKTAAEMYGIPGLRQTFKDIATNVVKFNCGMFFDPDFLAANPDMKVTLELIVFNDTDEILVDEGEYSVTPEEHVNTLVVGDTNKIVIDDSLDNGYGYYIELVGFVAEEPGYYAFAGEGLTIWLYDANNNLISMTGAANLEAGVYSVFIAANTVATTGEYNVAVTKSAWVNTLAVGSNKLLITDALDNGAGYYIVWVPFEVTEKANYKFGGDGVLALVYDAAYGAVSGTELDVGTYNICVAFLTPATTGVATVNVEKTAIGDTPVVEDPALALGDNTVVIDGSQVNLVGNAVAWYTFTPETAGTYTFACSDLTVYILTSKNMSDLNAYVGNGGVADLEAGVKYYVLVGKDGVTGEFALNISVGGVVVEKNTMVVGDNHYVITDALLATGFEFLTIEITEPGTYVITGGAPMKVYFFTVLAAEVVETSPFGWNVDAYSETGFSNSFTVTISEPGTYMMGFNYEFVTDEREFDINISLHTEHSFETGKCTVCGAVDPDYVEVAEPTGFAKVWAAILAFFAKIVEFFKGIFVK